MAHPYVMPKLQNTKPNIVTLLGGGAVNIEQLQRIMCIAPDLIAADGGADYAHIHEIPVTQIVGDFDSLTTLQIWQEKGVNLVQLDEQESTDFEKCLYSVAADIYLGVGFFGGRLDHTLASLRSLAAYPEKKVLLIGAEDFTILCPERFSLEMEAGDPVSLFPMGEVSGLGSSGLKWPIKGLNFSPSGQIGTSNEALGGQMTIELKGQKMLLILSLRYLEAVIDQLSSAL